MAGNRGPGTFMKTNEEQFTVFTTNDQRLKFQINIRNLSFCFIDLNFYSNRYEDLISVISPLNAELLNSSKKCYLIKNGSSVFTFL
ncbi:MAG: hypothetical protein JWQ40_4212 [Segetibacter sp.]|nr:hypothetical protein [Segetibacter sp.]